MVSVKNLSLTELEKVLDDPDNIENMTEDELDYVMETLGLDGDGCLARMEAAVSEKMHPSEGRPTYFREDREGLKVFGYIEAKSRREMTVAVLDQPKSEINDPLAPVREISIRNALRKIAAEGHSLIWDAARPARYDLWDERQRQKMIRIMDYENDLPKTTRHIKKT